MDFTRKLYDSTVGVPLKNERKMQISNAQRKILNQKVRMFTVNYPRCFISCNVYISGLITQ